MFKFIAALLGTIALTLIGVAPANAATTITFDHDGSGLPVAAAAADWSKNTDITVAQGDCTGPGCVHFKAIPSVCQQFGTQYAVNAGCAYRLGDGSCQVEVDSDKITYPGREWLDDLVTKHEAGHCIFAFGGKAVSFHLDDPRALMYWEQPGSPSRSQTVLTSIDRAFTRTLF